MRVDLADRALTLCRTLHELLPDSADTTSLLALLLLTDARRPTRTDERGDLVLLEDQDRTRWDHDRIRQGTALLDTAIAGSSVSRFTVMAAIAALHGAAPTWDETDWAQIVALYERLIRQWPSPVVALNRAIAIGCLAGPGVGLDELNRLTDEPSLAAYHYLPAARAEFLRRLGRVDEAREAYREAELLTTNDVETRFLNRRLLELT